MILKDDSSLKKNYNKKTSTICCYLTDEFFVKVHTEQILKKIDKLNNYKLIFSAHGLPEKNIKNGDPYQWQVEKSVERIIERLNIKDLDWTLSYQSLLMLIQSAYVLLSITILSDN